MAKLSICDNIQRDFSLLSEMSITVQNKFIHGKNDFAEGFKILPNTNLKIILLDHQNNFVRA